MLGQQTPFEQICDAIEEGELGARWLDRARPPRGIVWVPDEPSYFVGALRKRRMRQDNGGEIHWGGRRWRKLLLSRKDMSIFEPGVQKDAAAAKKPQQLTNNPRGIQEIHKAISAVYALAKEQGVKPPNVREIRKLAQRWLETHRGATAAGQWIEKAASDPQYELLRGPRGATVKGRLRPISELNI